jgi:hypothetical protein
MYSDQMKTVRVPAAEAREGRLKMTKAQAKVRIFFMNVSFQQSKMPPGQESFPTANLKF